MELGGASRDSTRFVAMEEGLISSEAGTSGFLSRGNRDLGVALQTHPGIQASSLVEAKNSVPLSSRDRYLLEHSE